jgi:predicted nucleotidyltransferase
VESAVQRYLPRPNHFWMRVKANAESSDKFDRVSSLASAAGSVEEALTASGVPRAGRQGLMKRAQLVAPPSPLWPSRQELEAAAKARNLAVHTLEIPSSEECISHTQVLYRAWCALQKAFVTYEKAAELAAHLASLTFVHDVFLFGSLARGAGFPRDIDLLVLDNGELSFEFFDYGTPLAGSLLEAADLSSEANRAAGRCGWLDVIVVEKSSFLNDKGYRLALARKQEDPLFFVNIAEDIRVFDPLCAAWNGGRPEIFEHLALLRKDLLEAGIVAPQRCF